MHTCITRYIVFKIFFLFYHHHRRNIHDVSTILLYNMLILTSTRVRTTLIYRNPGKVVMVIWEEGEAYDRAGKAAAAKRNYW